MAKSRKTPQIVNFDGEDVAMTRDLYEFSNRRRKTLLKRLAEMAELDEAETDSYAFKDKRGKLLGFVSVGKGELTVQANSVERADVMSLAVTQACQGILTFVRRADHEEFLKDAPPSPGGARAVTNLDQPIEGMGKSMRELLEDPETFAQLQAQLPPGVDLSTILQGGGNLFEGLGPDGSFDEEDDDEEDDDEEYDDEVSEGFRTLGLRLDLLDEQKSGLFWYFKVPEWLTLGALHRVISTLLGRPTEGPYAFHFPYDSYESGDEAGNHPDTSTLRRVFGEENQGFYGFDGPQWGFLIRCVRKFTLCRGEVELIRSEVFPPADSPTPADYLRRLKAKDLPRSEPFEVLERRLQRYVDPSASRVGPYLTIEMSLPTLLFAVLEARGEPVSLVELTHRAYISDCPTDVSLTTVRKTTKKAPFVTEPDGRITLNPKGAAFAKAQATLRKSLAPVGPRLMVRRFTSQTMTVQGQVADIVLVVDDALGQVHGSQVCSPSAGVQPMRDAIEEALKKFPQAVSVVIDDPFARDAMLDCHYFPEFQLSVDEPLEAFQALEQHSAAGLDGGGYNYPSGLSQSELLEFCGAAQRYYLLCPWVLLGDSDVFEIEGLTPKPLVVSVMGQAHEVYGLSVFEGLSNFKRFLDGDRDSFVTFMDFIEAPMAGPLRERIREAGGQLLDNDTFPFAYGVRGPATASQVRLLTEVLNLVCDRVDARGGVEDGTTEEQDSQNRSVRLSFPVDLDRESTAPESSSQKLGRNDPCWCGSGKKYKKCHG